MHFSIPIKFRPRIDYLHTYTAVDHIIINHCNFSYFRIKLFYFKMNSYINYWFKFSKKKVPLNWWLDSFCTVSFKYISPRKNGYPYTFCAPQFVEPNLHVQAARDQHARPRQINTLDFGGDRFLVKLPHVPWERR